MSMVRHLRLYRAFWRNCLRQTVDRANFWASAATNLGWLASLVLFLKLISINTHSAVEFFGLSVLFWRHATRAYSGASS